MHCFYLHRATSWGNVLLKTRHLGKKKNPYRAFLTRDIKSIPISQSTPSFFTWLFRTPHPFSWPYKALFSRKVQPFRMTWQARDHIPAKHVSASRSSPRLIPSRPETWKIIMAPAPLYVDSCSGGKKKTNKNNNKNIEHRFWFQLLLEGKWHQAPRRLAPLPFCVSLRAGRTLMLFILLNFSATRLALLFHIQVVVP